jgi:KipI family sensor histidine kinase inhibitor
VPRPTFTPYGEHGLLVELPDGPDVDDLDGVAAEVAGWVAALDVTHIPGVLDLVPAARSVLLLLDDTTSPHLVQAAIAELRPQPSDPPDVAGLVRVPVVYDGPDLAEVADRAGLSAAEVIAAHTGPTWRVAFAGFAPGFAYLVGGDDRLAVPRRESPRTRVPPGSVALAAGYSAVYPRASPGGWQLIGHTDAAMWDLTRDPPALLRSGQRVQFSQAE